MHLEISSRQIAQLGGNADDRTRACIPTWQSRTGIADHPLHRLIELFDQTAPRHLCHLASYFPSSNFVSFVVSRFSSGLTNPAAYASPGIATASPHPRCVPTAERSRGYSFPPQSALR